MYFKTAKASVIALLTIFLVAPNAFAVGSGGIRVELNDSEVLAKGNAFVGQADNPSTVYFNPAGLTQLKGKNHFSGGFAIIAPSASYTDFGGNETQMVRQNFPLPHLYLVSDFGVDNWIFGLAGLSSWGSGTAWADDSPLRYATTKADVKNVDTIMTAAYKFNEQWSFALGANHTWSVANKSKKLAQAGGADGDYNLKVKDSGWGYNLSTHFKLNENHKFGLIYKSPIQLKYRGKAFLHELNGFGSNFEGIFGGTSFETKVAEEFELPQSVVLGYSYQPDNKWTFNFDVEWMDWSSIEQEWLEFTEVLTADQAAVLNGGNPANRDWDAVWSIGLGGEYAWSDDLRIRGGYYQHTTPGPDENFEANLPDSNKYGITGGFGYDLTKNSTIDVAYNYLVYENITIDNEIASGTIKGKYEQIMHIGLVTYSYDF